MKLRILLTAMAVLLLAAPALADHHEKPGDHAGDMDMGPMGPPAEMKVMMGHVGDWDVTMKIRMAPDAPWMDCTGTSHVTSIFDGGVLHEKFESTMMGMPMTGFLILTYDREDHQYETIWMDSISCRTSHMAGQMKDGVMTMAGTDKYQGQDMWNRSTMTLKSADLLTFTMESSMDGENWFENMQMVYKRKSAK